MTTLPGFRVKNGRYTHECATLTEALAYVAGQIERGYWDLYPTVKQFEIMLWDTDRKGIAAVYWVEEAEAP